MGFLITNNKLLTKQTVTPIRFFFLENKHVAFAYQMDLPLLQKNNIFTSWNFPNLEAFIQNEQTMEADCK